MPMLASSKNARLRPVAEHADERQRRRQTGVAQFGGGLVGEERRILVLHGLRVLADLLALHRIVIGVAKVRPHDGLGQSHGPEPT